jgi:hypothetical protein
MYIIYNTMLYIIQALVLFAGYIAYVYYETQRFLIEKINEKKKEFEHARANLENLKENIFMTILPVNSSDDLQNTITH